MVSIFSVFSMVSMVAIIVVSIFTVISPVPAGAYVSVPFRVPASTFAVRLGAVHVPYLPIFLPYFYFCS
jgi:hypothetical protein